MGEGLITVDQSGAILDMNATAEDRLGWTRDELLGSSIFTRASIITGRTGPPTPRRRAR